jgi:hypothetical protein
MLEPTSGRSSVAVCNPPGVETRTRVDLPAYVADPYEVFINGVPQAEGTDYDVVGRSLFFTRTLATEGKLGFWRWLSMLLGIAGTYRKNDTVDVVFTVDGKRRVASLALGEPEPDQA